MDFTVAGVLLDACVLGALSAASAYGYELTQKTQTLLGVSESALYPVLRRLLRDGYLETYDESYDGRNRRYYRITEKGAGALRGYERDWKQYKDDIGTFLNGGDHIEQE